MYNILKCQRFKFPFDILGKFRQTRVLSLDDAMHVLSAECIHTRMCSRSRQTQTHTGSKSPTQQPISLHV